MATEWWKPGISSVHCECVVNRQITETMTSQDWLHDFLLRSGQIQKSRQKLCRSWISQKLPDAGPAGDGAKFLKQTVIQGKDSLHSNHCGTPNITKSDQQHVQETTNRRSATVNKECKLYGTDTDLTTGCSKNMIRYIGFGCRRLVLE